PHSAPYHAVPPPPPPPPLFPYTTLFRSFRGHQLVLGLRRKLRVRHLDRQHGGEAFAAIIAGQRDLFLLRIGLGIAVDLARQRARSEEHTSELQSRFDLVCRLLLEDK